MKRTILLAASLILTLGTTTGFLLSKVTNPMKIHVHAKDLPKHGLIIVKPSDPEFDALAASLLSAAALPNLEAIRPFAIIVKNTSTKTVVAHTIVWEGLKPNGGRKTYRVSYSNSEFFTEGADTLQALARTNFDKTIKPGSARLLSLVPLQGSDAGGGGGARHPQDESRSRPGDANLNNQEAARAAVSSLLADYAAVTVSIDGAFFDDGTFVGPDTSDFFTLMKAQVDAKHDLHASVVANLNLKRPKAEIFQSVQAKADMDVSQLTDESSSSADYHAYFTKFFATQLLQKKWTVGEEKALNDIRRSGGKRRPTLVKIED